MVSNEFHCIFWASKGCGGVREVYPFLHHLLCAVVLWHTQQCQLELGTSVLGHGVSSPKESESVSVCVNIPGLKPFAYSTVFLAWPRETPRRRQVGLAEQWKCLCLRQCRFPTSSRSRLRFAVVFGSLPEFSCKQISPSQVSLGAKLLGFI